MSVRRWSVNGLHKVGFAKTIIAGGTAWGTQAVIAIVLCVALPLLGMSGIASAQSSAVNIQGTIDAVDCQAQTMVIDTENGQQTFATSDNAFTNVDSANLPFCSLEGYIGAPATVWLAPENSQLVVTEVNVTGPVPTAPPAAAGVSPLPIWGAVLGTVVVAGLLYLVTRGPDGNYYRYPYYGAYYHRYYNTGYRPYTGFYPSSSPIVTVALAIIGAVIGTVIVNGDPYIVSRDSGGHFYRYPYYGPYHQYYYRPSYQPYTGVNVNVYRQATVYQGNAKWDAPAYAMAKVYGTPAVRDFPQQQPPAGTHQLTGTPSPRQPQAGTQRPTGTAPQQPQPTTNRPTGTTPHQPQPEPDRRRSRAQPATQPTQQQPAKQAPQQAQPATAAEPSSSRPDRRRSRRSQLSSQPSSSRPDRRRSRRSQLSSQPSRRRSSAANPAAAGQTGAAAGAAS